MTNHNKRTDSEARVVMQGMRHAAGTLFRALDTDCDGILSAEEIAAAPGVLRSLDTDKDGFLREEDFGGPTHIPGMVRRSGIVRLLDPDGQLVIGPQDMAEAAERIMLLDADGDGQVTAEDDLPLPGSNVEMRMPMGTPAEVLDFQEKLFTRATGITGPLPPSGSPLVQPGYMLVHEVNDRGDVQKSKRTFLMDEHGEIAHIWHTSNRLSEATVSYLMPDGNLLRTTCARSWIVMDGQFPIGANGTVSIEAPDGSVLWQWSCFSSGKEALHHDVEIMPNGNILLICWDVMPAHEARQRGWNQQDERRRIILDKIYEIRPDLASGNAAIVWQWSTRDHLVQNTDSSAPNFGEPNASPERIDINWAQLSELQFNSGQLFHTNSVSYDEREDIILLSSAAFGEIWIIDHSTTTQEAAGSTGGSYGRGGDLIWRWGNPQTHDKGTAEDQILFWQHDAHFVANNVPHSGDVMVFNNGMRRTAEGKPDPDQICMGLITDAYSDVLELKLPRNPDGLIESGEPPEIVWNFNSDGTYDVYSPFMSGAQRMPNGNTLMAQGCDKRIVEVSPGGDILMDFHVGGPGRMYRIYKYPPDYPGIVALNL